jgi:hypothetical protein
VSRLDHSFLVGFLAILGLGRGVFVGLPAILELSRRIHFRMAELRRARQLRMERLVYTRPVSVTPLLRWRLLYQALDHLAALSLEPLPGSERRAIKDGSTSSHSTHRAPPVRFDDTT